jgi:hypothetical protein
MLIERRVSQHRYNDPSDPLKVAVLVRTLYLFGLPIARWQLLPPPIIVGERKPPAKEQ